MCFPDRHRRRGDAQCRNRVPYKFTVGKIAETLMNDYSAEVSPSTRSLPNKSLALLRTVERAVFGLPV